MNRIASYCALSLIATSAAGCGGPAEELDTATTEQDLIGTVTLDFDHDPNGSLIAGGTNVSATYAADDVRLYSHCSPPYPYYATPIPSCSSGPVYAAPQSGTNQNGVSPFSTGAWFNQDVAYLEAVFSQPVSKVSIDAVIAGTQCATPMAPGCVNENAACGCNFAQGRLWMEAFDSQGNLVDWTYYQPTQGQPGWNEWRRLMIDSDPTNVGLANIASVRFTADSNIVNPFDYVHAWASFDNLVVTVDAAHRRFAPAHPILPLPPGSGL